MSATVHGTENEYNYIFACWHDRFEIHPGHYFAAISKPLGSHYILSIAVDRLRASRFPYELVSIRDSRQSYFVNVAFTKAELTDIINYICSSYSHLILVYPNKLTTFYLLVLFVVGALRCTIIITMFCLCSMYDSIINNNNNKYPTSAYMGQHSYMCHWVARPRKHGKCIWNFESITTTSKDIVEFTFGSLFIVVI